MVDDMKTRVLWQGIRRGLLVILAAVEEYLGLR